MIARPPTSDLAHRPGAGDGLTATGSQLWSQNSASISDATETADRFRSALAISKLNCDVLADLVVEVPSEDYNAISLREGMTDESWSAPRTVPEEARRRLISEHQPDVAARTDDVRSTPRKSSTAGTRSAIAA